MTKLTVAAMALLATSAAIAGTQSNADAFVGARGLFVNGMTPATITLSNQEKKTIRLMNVSLSTTVQQSLAEKAAFLLAHPQQKNLASKLGLPAAKDDGMNNEPVLDQGEWGTCATFSSTAAINALYGLTEDARVSQLCNLALGRGINDSRMGDGGWQGAFGYLILGQVNQYGYLDKQYQHQIGCGGLKNYPTYSSDNGSSMSTADFTAHSVKTFTDKDWMPLLSYNGNFSPITPAQAETTLNNVKTAINAGYRVVFGTLIDGNVGEVGAAGTYKNIANDTWVMTTQMQQDLQNGNVNEGHEIIIEGYDDNACATYTDADATSKKQCGLLHIRNSWSANAGDQGDYYMSYDHFKGMVIEAYAIGQDVKDQLKLTAVK